MSCIPVQRRRTDGLCVRQHTVHLPKESVWRHYCRIPRKHQSGGIPYDAYGKCTVILNTAGIATINPFRFKGYYFDSESGMYYCHTRYYVPEWCRWLNADHPSFLQPESLQGLNLYTYCGNNPVMYKDPSGAIVISLLVGLAVSFAVGFISSTIAHVR